MNLDFYSLGEAEKQKYKLEQDKKYLEKELGEEILELLKDPNITEIMLNNDDKKNLWVDKFGEGMVETDIVIDNVKALKIIENIASYNRKVVNDDEPILDASLPGGERVSASIGEIVDYSPILTIRKPPSKIFTLQEYVNAGILKSNQRDFIIENFISKRKNLLIVGGTSSGKTTFANACLAELENTKDRIIIMEDTKELQCKAKNIVRLKSTTKVPLSSLIKLTMRMNPTRLIVGEARDGEVCLQLLIGLNSGHPGGLVTIHADSAQLGLKKMEQYTDIVSQRAQTSMIADVFNLIVYIERNENQKRYVKEIFELKGYDEINKKYILESIENVL